MKVSIISFAFSTLQAQGKTDIFGYLESCRYRFGLSTADIWGGSLASLDEDYLKKVRDGIEERGLECVCLASDKADLWVEDPDKRAANHQSALRHLEAARILGARTVRFNSGGDPNALEWTAEQYDYVASTWREYARQARDAGFRVGPENHWGPEDVPAQLQRLCRDVNDPAFGVLLHFGRWKGDGSERGDQAVAPWVMHTHINTRITPESLPQRMAALRDAGYRGCWGIEMVSSRYTEMELWVTMVRDVLERWRQERP